MLLSDRDLRAALAAGSLVVEPLADGAVQPASIDLHLGGDAKVRAQVWWAPWRRAWRHVDITRPLRRTIRHPFRGGHPAGTCGWWLPAGRFALGCTREIVGIPADLTGVFCGRSSVARTGLGVEDAGWIDPGFQGMITVELRNALDEDVLLIPGQPIGQLAVLRLTSPADAPYGCGVLGSRYQGQQGATVARMPRPRTPLGNVSADS